MGGLFVAGFSQLVDALIEAVKFPKFDYDGVCNVSRRRSSGRLTQLHVKSGEETGLYTDPPIRGYIALSAIGILLIVIVPAVGFFIYGS